MSFCHLCPQLGHIAHKRECTYNGLDVLVVLEEFLADRWIIFYRRRSGDLEIFARYILLDKWTNRGYQQIYAPVVDVGISLDKDKSHIVIEQDRTHRCIFVFDYGEPAGAQKWELSMWAAHRRREEVGEHKKREEVGEVEAIQGSVATSALRRLPQMHGEILDKKMVASIYSRKAFVLEQAASDKWLDVYTWTDASWILQDSCKCAKSIGIGIQSLRAPIVDIFVQDTFMRGKAIVVEENQLFRWWHTYNWDGNTWKHRISSEILLCNDFSLSSEEIVWNTNCKEEEAQLQSLKKEGEDNKYVGGTAEVNKKEVEVIDLSMED